MLSKEAFIVTSSSYVPSQHQFLQQEVLKGPLRRKAEEKTYQLHLSFLEMVLLANLQLLGQGKNFHFRCEHGNGSMTPHPQSRPLMGLLSPSSFPSLKEEGLATYLHGAEHKLGSWEKVTVGRKERSHLGVRG